MKVTKDQAAAKAAVVDCLKRGMSIAEAAKVAGYARRTVHLWIKKDFTFAGLVAEAQKNRTRVVAEGQVEDWRAELRELEAKIRQIEADLLDVAAPARMGDAEAQSRQVELQLQLQEARDQAAALSVSLESAERHMAKAREQEAEAARQEAAAEAGEQQQVQAAAAARIDAALAEIEDAWQQFNAASISRSVASRRAGHRHRAAHDRLLIQAAFAKAPAAATALGLDRMLRTRHSRPLSETVG